MYLYNYNLLNEQSGKVKSNPSAFNDRLRLEFNSFNIFNVQQQQKHLNDYMRPKQTFL